MLDKGNPHKSSNFEDIGMRCCGFPSSGLSKMRDEHLSAISPTKWLGSPIASGSGRLGGEFFIEFEG
jgi:hypothetical protein